MVEEPSIQPFCWGFLTFPGTFIYLSSLAAGSTAPFILKIFFWRCVYFVSFFVILISLKHFYLQFSMYSSLFYFVCVCARLCLLVGLFMPPHPSDHVRKAQCVLHISVLLWRRWKQKWLTDWQCHLLSSPEQLKIPKKIDIADISHYRHYER